MSSLVAQSLSTSTTKSQTTTGASLTTNAEVILKKRYLHNGESIDNLWHRVADGNEKYIKLLASLRFLPNSPTLFNAGLNNGCTLAACFVFEVRDEMRGSMSSIVGTREKAIAVAKAGGGVGYYFGNLRPKGSPIKTIQRVACGPVTVLKDYHYISHLITQGGKRELAQMGILNCDHQDIYDFIHCKDSDPQGLGSFNISVSWSDKYVYSAHRHADDTGETAYKLWQEQCKAAWAHGCPGMFFYDTVNKASPNKHLGLILATNPCGEVPNRSDEPCNLGSLSLPRYFTKFNRGIDWSLLEEDIYTSSEFLDDILDRNTFPHPDITEAALLTRKLGLGLMGWADLLAMMHIHYDTEEALQLGEKIMKLFHDVSHRCSEDLANKKGPYKGYSATKTEAPMRRNETSTSIAPTGTIAILAGVWGSIEPHFALRCERTTNEGIKLQDGISDWVYDQLDGFTPKIASEISPEWHVRHQAAFQKYTDLGCSKTVNLPNSATIEDVSSTYKLMHELGCKGGTIYRDGCRQEQVLVKQEKTKSVYLVNQSAPTNGYHEKIEEQPIPVQMQQYLSSARMQVQSIPVSSPKRRHLGDCITKRHRFRVGGCNIYLHVGLFDDGSPGEIFLRASKWGSTIAGMIDSWAIAVSRLLQYGVPVAEIAKDNRGNRFEPNGLTNNPQIPTCTSIPDYVVRWLELTFNTDAQSQVQSQVVSVSREEIVAKTEKVVSETLYGSGCYCPDCGAELIYQASCLCCLTQGCGFSKCS